MREGAPSRNSDAAWTGGCGNGGGMSLLPASTFQIRFCLTLILFLDLLQGGPWSIQPALVFCTYGTSTPRPEQ